MLLEQRTNRPAPDGVGITGLNNDAQTDLFGDSASVKSLEASEKAVDKVPNGLERSLEKARK